MGISKLEIVLGTIILTILISIGVSAHEYLKDHTDNPEVHYNLERR